MKSLFVRMFILISYVIMLVYLLVTQKIRSYLHPRFDILLWLTALFMLGQVVYIFLKKTNNKDSIITLTILILPLIFSFSYSPNIQDQVVDIKGINLLNSNHTDVVEENISIRNVNLSETMMFGDHENKAKLGELYLNGAILEKKSGVLNLDNDNYLESVEKIIDDPVAYYGYKINISGIVVNSENLPENYSIISRTLITCCLADAEIIGLLMKSNETFKDETWYNIVGEVTITKQDNTYYPTIEVTRSNELNILYNKLDMNSDIYLFR